VSRTGLRRTLHVASAAFLVLIPATSWPFFRATLLATAVIAVALEAVRLRVPRIRLWLGGRVPVFRQEEARQPCGAMWLAVGYAIASLFHPPAAMGGVLVGACADPVAAWVGGAGRTTTGKTWRGSTAHFVMAWAVLLLAGFPLVASVGAATVGTALERWSGPFNDNVIVAPAVAASVSLLH